MKILLIANVVSGPDRISNYMDMWSYYLSRSLLNNGVEVTYYSPRFQSSSEFIEGVLTASIESC